MKSTMLSRSRLASVIGPFLGLGFIALLFFVYDLTANGSLENFEIVFSLDNLRTIAQRTAPIAAGALGLTIVIISGGIDLSAGSVMALTTVVIALALKGSDGAEGFSPGVALCFGLAVATLAGFCNGLLITRLKIVPFIATLGMMSVARGLAKLLSDQQKISVQRTWISDILSIDPLGPPWQMPWGTFVVLGLAVLLALVLRYSVFGRYVFAIGSNERTAILCGIKVDRQKLYLYALCGFFVGVAAVMQFSKVNSGDPSSAMGKELDLIAAVVIGGGSLSGGKGGVLGTLIGASIIGLLRNSCDIYLIPNSTQDIVIGAIIVSAAAVDHYRARRAAA
ncbi:MAG: ABC transporter permease [Planctomycetota bacterium]